MNKNLKSALQYIAFTGIGGLLLYFTYKDTPLSELWDQITQAKWWIIAISFIMGYLAIISRGLRWNLLLEPMEYRAKAWHCIHSVSFGYFANTFVPRSGEVARCVALNQTDDVPVDRLIGTVIMERIVDSCMLLIFLSLAVFSHLDAFARLMEFTDVGDGSGVLKLLMIGGGVVVFLLALFLLLRKHLMKSKLVNKVLGFLMGMKDGLQSLFKMKRRAAFLGHTFFIWGMYYLMAYIVFFALPDTRHLSMLDGLFIVVAGGLGMVFPSPGGTGSYQYAVMLGFIALGLSEQIGVLFGTIVWATQTIMILSTGLVASLALFLARKKKARLQKMSHATANK